MGRRAAQRGMAIVLVLTVLLALILIATPFVLSMLLQEKTATVEKEQRQADYGAEGARNFAAWWLYYGNDYMERRYQQGGRTSYYYDELPEFVVEPGATLPGGVNIRDSRGKIWGVSAQDEQGKINTRTAPSRVLGRVQQYVDSRVVNHKDYLTLYSVREARWIFPQRIRGVGNIQIDPATNVYGISVDNALHYGRGARIRVTKPGANAVEATVTRNLLLVNGANAVETNPQIAGGFAGGIIEVEARHPVNINTAPREVLISIFEGLRVTLPGATPISSSQAQTLADFFHKRPATRRLEEFILAVGTLNALTTLQKTAVIMNAINPLAATLDDTGTLPVTFKSHDVLTIEAFATVNTPAGTSRAGRGFREVVALAPPIFLTRFLESQYDFDLPLMNAAAQGYYGFPFGYRITTFPNMLPKAISDTALKPQPLPMEAYFQITPSVDNRGISAYEASIADPATGQARYHYVDTQEGNKLVASSATWAWNRVFSPHPNPPPNNIAQLPDVAAGGMEMWVRFDQIVNPTILFDIQEGPYTNRVSLRYENTELIFTVADATVGVKASAIDDGIAEIRFPFAPVDDKTWTHIGAYWKSTKYAHMVLLVDGFCSPAAKFMHTNPEGQRIMTKLTGALSQTATSWAIQDTSFLPTNESSVWQIGGEVLIYDTTTGQLVRGQRGTAAQDHPKDATVQIFGYSSKLRKCDVTVNYTAIKPTAGTANLTQYDRVSMGGGTLLYNFGQNPTATVMGDKDDMGQTYVDATQADIPVTSADIMQFPDMGHIMIEDEVIYYTGRTAGATPKFTGCQRGQHGTVAVRHDTGRPVALWGFAANDTTNYLQRTILQIDDEWFGPMEKDTTHANHWIPYVNVTIPGPMLRGGQMFGSTQASHTAGTLIIPTFFARESDPLVVRNNIGPGDRVTLIDAGNQREYHQVRRAAVQNPIVQFTTVPDGQIAAFRANAARDYVADELHVRVLKFPAGELLSLSFLQTANPQFSIGAMTGTIDEVKFFASPKGNFLLARTITETPTSVTMNSTAGMAPTGGAIKLGDEIIGYASNKNNVLDPARRGWLNSEAQVHDQGDLAFNLSFLPIGTLAAPIQPTDREMRLWPGTFADTQDPSKPRYFIDQPDGYAAVVQNFMGGVMRGEVVMYTDLSTNGDGTVTLRMPPRMDSFTEGMFRGMFGTIPLDAPAETLVYFMPYRFWDTYKPQQFDNKMAYYQTSTTLDLANFRKVGWIEEKPANDNGLVTHVLVRIDGKGEWFDPTTGRTWLFEFTDPSGKNPVNRIGYQNDAGQIDLRFYFEYRNYQGASAFWPGHTWKRATRIKQVMVDYDRPNRTLYHEDR